MMVRTKPLTFPAGSSGPWSAFRWWFPAMTGYDRMVVHNSTHITWEHVLTGGGFVVDSVTIIQPDHGLH